MQKEQRIRARLSASKHELTGHTTAGQLQSPRGTSTQTTWLMAKSQQQHCCWIDMADAPAAKIARDPKMYENCMAVVEPWRECGLRRMEEVTRRYLVAGRKILAIIGKKESKLLAQNQSSF